MNVPLIKWLTAFVKHKASQDRKSTRLNSSHLGISYAVFCLKKKKKHLAEDSVMGAFVPVRSTVKAPWRRSPSIRAHAASQGQRIVAMTMVRSTSHVQDTQSS